MVSVFTTTVRNNFLRVYLFKQLQALSPLYQHLHKAPLLVRSAEGRLKKCAAYFFKEAKAAPLQGAQPAGCGGKTTKS
jgi:hypothetical protein